MATFTLSNKYEHKDDVLTAYGRFTTDAGITRRTSASVNFPMEDRQDSAKRQAAITAVKEALKQKMKETQAAEDEAYNEMPQAIYDAVTADIDAWLAGGMQ